MRAGWAFIASLSCTHCERKLRRSGMTSKVTLLKFTVIFAAVSLFLYAQLARAAENKSTIAGTVQDASGKPVTGAFVKLKNSDRHLEFMVISQAQGHYTVSDLPAGQYVIQGV